MGKLIILNGSPRAPRSNSKQYAAIFQAKYPGECSNFSALQADFSQFLPAFEQCSDVLLVFPLYVDGLPSTLLAFLKELVQAGPRNRPVFHVLINCGFLEPMQNETALEMVALFCRRHGFPFGCTLSIGGGEAILNTPFAFLAKKQIRKLAAAVWKRQKKAYTVTMPLRKKWFVQASTNYWLKLGQQNGLTKEQMETMEVESHPLSSP